MSLDDMCPNCDGTGEVHDRHTPSCSQCRGTGLRHYIMSEALIGFRAKTSISGVDGTLLDATLIKNPDGGFAYKFDDGKLLPVYAGCSIYILPGQWPR